jgi:hypothetical protein
VAPATSNSRNENSNRSTSTVETPAKVGTLAKVGSEATPFLHQGLKQQRCQKLPDRQNQQQKEKPLTSNIQQGHRMPETQEFAWKIAKNSSEAQTIL